MKVSQLYIHDRMSALSWERDRAVRDLIKETEKLFCDTFTKGNRHEGMCQLRLPDHSKRNYQDITWVSGFLIGAGICLLIQCVVLGE
jgi:hypothetical protein